MRSFTCSAELEPLRQIQIAPHEIGTAQRVAAEIAELAVRRIVAAGARAGARIDRRNERVRVEPLNRSRLRHARDRIVLVHAARRERRWRIADRCPARFRFRWPSRARSARKTAGRCARTRCRKPAIRSAHRASSTIPQLQRQLIHVLRGEVVPHIVIARAVLPAQDRRAAAKELRPRRTAGIRRSRPCPCSGSRCS